ncbi:MAG: carbohydrate kinase [Saprospiraceae bacterium]|nr:carbohydrate kinase [Saprospiraceae bacterium]
MLSLGIDVGSSSVKVAIYNHELGKAVASGQYPKTEMSIVAHQTGWAEQEPQWWWQAFLAAYRQAVSDSATDTLDIQAIGISYQMHGLVCLDKEGKPLRPSIIWCDSRAVEIGQSALQALGEDYAFNHLLNSPGNFTASKLKWVKENEPHIFEQIYHICLPGDYIAYKLTGQLTTTITGLSEGIFYDFKEKRLSEPLLKHYGFSSDVFPTIKNSFDYHGTLLASVADELRLSHQAAVTYKAGDQPNNALSLKVLNAGEIAATAGTSGVVYGVSNHLFIDYSQRVNSFAHINYQFDAPKIGILLCINGVGIANAWANKWTRAESYAQMNDDAMKIPMGSEQLQFLPFGNGAERMLGNAAMEANLLGINFNRHTPAHLYRAVQEGIAFSFMFGMETFEENKILLSVIRAGYANMFLSSVFGEILATLSGVTIELYDTDGALGAARGALVGAKLTDLQEVFKGLNNIKTYEPNLSAQMEYRAYYQAWKHQLNQRLNPS